MVGATIPLLLTVAAGVRIVVQQVLNANLCVALSSAAWSGVVRRVVVMVCMALRDPLPSAIVAARIPWWAWSGGLFGAIFIGLSIFLTPQIGPAIFIALLVTGQMLASVTVDHFGWLRLA